MGLQRNGCDPPSCIKQLFTFLPIPANPKYLLRPIITRIGSPQFIMSFSITIRVGYMGANHFLKLGGLNWFRAERELFF